MSLPMCPGNLPWRGVSNAPPRRVGFRQEGRSGREVTGMDDEAGRTDRDGADDLLRRALIDPEAAVAVSLRVRGLALAEALTVIFHGRGDLGTIQTYVAHGGRGPGEAVAASELLRVPCDLDLGDAA